MTVLAKSIVAFNEEILVRGYVLTNLMASMNKYWALVVSALLF
ncbi:MAG: CPBP family intramembrane metalloprotease, partial [Alteromonadales bacterium]|nr:CPBP family intramembrane metalloprotease [Alteromonadales bacterium]